MKDSTSKMLLLKKQFSPPSRAKQYLGMACLFLLGFLQPYLTHAQTFNGTTGSIPDATQDPDENAISSTVDFTANVTGLPGTIGTDYTIANVTINIEHTWNSDLDISLVGPDGTTTLNLSDDNGDQGMNYTNTVFTDAASTNITAGFPPFAGSFNPEGPGTLASVFNGSAVNGIWTLRITDDLNLEEGTLLSWSITFQAVNPYVWQNCPSNMTTTACQTQSAVNNAFALWLLRVSAGGGCDGVLSNNNIAQGGAPPRCGGSRTVTFTYTSSCLPFITTCQATFTVPTAPSVTLTCPADITTSPACRSQAEIDGVFSLWLASASGSGGCNGTLTNNSVALGGAPPACGGSRTVTFIYTSACGTLTTTCQATFTVPTAPTVTITCPTNTTTAACQTEVQLGTAYSNWLNTASFSGGCNGSLTSTSGVPSVCGSSTTLTFTHINACGNQSCQATFTVPAPPPVVLTCPTNQEEAFGQTQAAINAAFNAWLATATASGGCGGTFTNNNTGAPPATGGSVTVMFTKTSTCAPLTSTCQATFTVSSTPPVVLTCPANATASRVCLTQDQLTAEYNAWLATASGSGGCGGELTHDGATPPSICSATETVKTVTFTYTSTCEPFITTCLRTFTVPAYPDFTPPPNSGTTRVCLTQTEPPTPPQWWDRCGNLIIPTGPVMVDAPDPITCEGTRTFTYTYTDCAGHSYDWSFVWTLDVPTLLVDPPGRATVPCPSFTPPTYPNYITNTDACGRPVTITGPTVTSSPDPITCEGTKTYTWDLTDCAGNTNTWSWIITIERNDFTLPENGGSTVACPADADVVPTPPSKMSECGEPIIPTGPVVTSTPTCEGTKTYTWTYTDCAGHSHDWSYIYTIERNDFTVPANGSATVACPSDITVPTPPTVTSHCGETITPTGPVIVNTPDPLVNAGTRVYTYTYTDCEGNLRTWSFTYTVSPAQVFYQDLDNDGYGNPAVSVNACTQPSGYVIDATDCNDGNAALNPTTVWYLDADNDGYSTGASITQCASPGPGYRYTGVLGGDDCDDNNAALSPGLATCFQDCNGVYGGPALPGTACNDGDATTINDTWTDNCQCTGTQIYVLAGNIVWEHDMNTPVAAATVALSGDDADSDNTDSSGDYEISTTGGNLTLTPTKNDNPRQGVTAADASRIRQHVLGTNRFNDGYKAIAADVNESNSVTNADATIIQQALLGNAGAGNHLDNPAWRFVDAAHTFVNENAPWGFPMNVGLTGVAAAVQNIDFVGVKMGDVNGTWGAQPALTAQPAVWLVANENMEAGTNQRVAFALGESLPDVAAWQFALRLDPAYATVNRITPKGALPLTREDFGVENLRNGELRSVFAQAQGQPLKAGEVVFELELTVRRSALLSDVLTLDNDILEGRVYNTALKGGAVKLAFAPVRDKPGLPTVPTYGEAAFELYQNVPNPFAEETIIAFNLPTEAAATITVQDASGRVVALLSGDYSEGFNSVRLTHGMLKGATGVLTYTVTAGTYTATRRMLVVE